MRLQMDAFITCDHISYTIRRGATLRVGRAIDCDIRLFKDQRVSRQHCLIANTDDCVTIVDVGSRHGTTVNGVPATSHPTVLQEGDVIRLGESQMVFHQFEGEGPGEDTRSWPARY
ncbi:MAG: FHA domain-containing protein [Fuerstiella sp.]